MTCPRCGGRSYRCVDSRPRKNGRYRRYRCCCGEKFSTIERIVPLEEDRKIRYLMNTLQRIEREMTAARRAVKRGEKSAAPAQAKKEESHE